MPVLQAGLAAAMNALDVMLGKPPGTYSAQLVKSARISDVPNLADIGSPADLLRRRPDLIVAERRLAASNARIGEAISEYYPKLSVGALLGTATSVSSGNLFSSGASQASAVLGLRWRLFDFGRINVPFYFERKIAVFKRNTPAASRFTALTGRFLWRERVRSRRKEHALQIAVRFAVRLVPRKNRSAEHRIDVLGNVPIGAGS